MAQSLPSAQVQDGDHTGPTGNIWTLALGSIGVVYGDIGTSPLYAFKEAVAAAKAQGAASPTAVYGILSLIVWGLILIVTIKYVLLLLRADNKGEGGTFALMALGQSVATRSAPLIAALGITGAAFFYGDSIITPAISVLSAVEGLRLVTPALDNVVLPLTVVILIVLFSVQSHGTAAVAQYFGPIMLVWFLALAVGGILHAAEDMRIFHALNPIYGVRFIVSHGLLGLTVMGLVFLAVTGAEALYADLGHFGRKPIQMAWLCLILPSLILNYFGQGALLLTDPAAIENPFYRLYPGWALLPMVLLATVATVIASQAVITGAFSITRQAIALGLLPRLSVRHTSESMAGQIYLPRVNHLLLAGVLFVTILFRDSSNLAAAYGVSVTATMVIDSLMAFFVIWRCWGWPLWKVAGIIVPLIIIEQSFFTANMLKVIEGGWLPLVVAAFMATIMMTWMRGVRALGRATRKNEADLDWLIRKLEAKPPHRVSGTAVFLTGDPDSAPTSLMHNLKHNRVLHERNIILTIRTVDTPRVPRHDRITIERVSDTFIKVIAR
ncbi:MAG: potassium transporter Kup, partial [Hyphomicrobiaceae bacterium]